MKLHLMDFALFLRIILRLFRTLFLLIFLKLIDGNTLIIFILSSLNLVFVDLVSDRASMEVQLVANVEIFMVHRMHSMLAWERNLINMRQRWEIGRNVAVRTVDVQVVEIMMAAMKRVAMLMSHQVIVKGLHLQNKVAVLGVNL